MSLRLRPGQRGVELRLHTLEAEIMNIVWSRRLDRFTVGDVLAVLEKRRNIAYTTVMTTLGRLHDKDVLARVKDGKRYLYSAKLTREAFLESTAREVLDGLGAREPALALLVEAVSEADTTTLDELEALIRRRRQEIEP
ncbi:MAG: BlaI/MecI/CopY family transcriptional regulator [Sandaracinaceae bacterium]|nr:BlaI/MecI/CopY family transcriptional regulator [Sandaracinaceae bacterium]